MALIQAAVSLHFRHISCFVGFRICLVTGGFVHCIYGEPLSSDEEISTFDKPNYTGATGAYVFYHCVHVMVKIWCKWGTSRRVDLKFKNNYQGHSSFLKSHNIGNNVNISIRGFTM